MATKQIGEVAGNVVTSMRARTTKARDISTEMPSLKGWMTFGDPTLERMQLEAQRFLLELQQSDSSPRWLSFVGESGTGKTFLCNQIRENAPINFLVHPIMKRAGFKVHWPEMLSILRDGDFSIFSEVHPLMLIDDIGASTDTEFASAQLLRLLGQRDGKWTMITSNLTLEGIAERIDTRLSSRLIRDRNVCVEVDTMDFALRKP